MRIRNILPVLLAMTAITSCSVYRTGQTPDDVYYSPGRSADDSYLTVDNPRKGRSYGRYDYTDPQDNYLRMRQYGSRWSTFDDYNDWQYNGGYYGMYSPYTPYSSFYNGFGYSPYGYGSVFFGTPYAYYNPWSYNSYFNSYYYWNSYYNPYAYGIVVGKSNPVMYQSVRNFNMNSYTNVNYNNRNARSSRPIYSNQNGRFSTNSYNNGTTGGLRRVYPSNNYNNNNNGGFYTPTQRSVPTYSPAPVRTYSPSSGGSSGGGGGRPSRGH